MESNLLFPIFIKLNTIKILVIGGGNVALEKMSGIKRADAYARVVLIGKIISNELQEFVQDMPNVEIKEREFDVTDIEGCQLVISATDDHEVQILIKETCHNKGILCNVADTPDLCDFYLGSVVQKGNLKIAISTNGKSPTIAKRIKEMLDEVFPNDIDEVLENINVIRKRISGDFTYKVKKLNEITKILIEKGY